MLKQVIELLKPDVDSELKLTGVSMFFGRWLEKLNRRVVDLEARQLQKGDKGDKGDPGPQGKAGLNGRDGLNGKDGKDGINGKDGKNGIDGKAGISVVDAEIAADGSLVFKLSNGKEIDVGQPIDTINNKGYYVSSVGGHQIIVSATAPTNPSPNDLWYDIS